MGAAELIPMDDYWRILEQVKALTGGRFCERVIEAVGKQWPLDLAGELTAEGGRLVIAGYHQDGPRQVNMQLWNWRGLDVINAHERDPAGLCRGYTPMPWRLSSTVGWILPRCLRNQLPTASSWIKPWMRRATGRTASSRRW